MLGVLYLESRYIILNTAGYQWSLANDFEMIMVKTEQIYRERGAYYDKKVVKPSECELLAQQSVVGHKVSIRSTCLVFSISQPVICISLNPRMKIS